MKYPFLIPELPPIEALIPSLKQIWDSKVLSNYGPTVRCLEKLAAEFYGTDPELVVSCCNATIGLIVAIKALQWNSHTYVPSYTFPATVQALQWNSLPYTYLDIDKDTHLMDTYCVKNPESSNLLLLFPYGVPLLCNLTM